MFEGPPVVIGRRTSNCSPCDAPRVPSLKTFLALLTALLAAGGATAAIVFAVQRSHDGVPERLRSCAEDRGAYAVKTSESMSSARPDVLAGRRLRARTFALGQDRGVLLQGVDYAVLVVRAPNNPALGGDLLRRVYRDPSPWALVAVERDPVRGVLAGCAAREG
jgi:hypothetical protein